MKPAASRLAPAVSVLAPALLVPVLANREDTLTTLVKCSRWDVDVNLLNTWMDKQAAHSRPIMRGYGRY